MTRWAGRETEIKLLPRAERGEILPVRISDLAETPERVQVERVAKHTSGKKNKKTKKLESNSDPELDSWGKKMPRCAHRTLSISGCTCGHLKSTETCQNV